ncbi:MAG TPA: hypothetical protein VIK89_06245, partial [Cytophagaceae bacterium]
MNFSRILILLVCVLLGASCNEIFEKPVENSEMYINSPADSITSSSFTQTFWWEPVEGAANYRLQIVSPSFKEIRAIAVDSIITSTKCKIVLDSGSYEWMVWAFNNTSNNKGKVKPRFLRIIPGSLTEQPLLDIESPEANSFTGDTSITFKWKPLPVANIRYRIQISNAPFKADDLLVDEVFEGNSFVHNFNGLNANTAFAWKVRAESVSGEAGQWSGPYTFTIDRQKPLKVTLASPSIGALVTKGNVTLEWKKSEESDIAYYKLYVYQSDSSTYYN